MQKLYCYSTAFVLVFTILSCQKNFQNDNVCDGLLQMGAADSARFLMAGTDWEFKYFAYTPDGKEIITKEVPARGILRTTGTDTLRFYCANEGLCIASFLAGSNELKIPTSPHTMVYLLKEEQVLYALNNATCYSIKGDMLYIHFRESEGNNLFILQKK